MSLFQNSRNWSKTASSPRKKPNFQILEKFPKPIPCQLTRMTKTMKMMKKMKMIQTKKRPVADVDVVVLPCPPSERAKMMANLKREKNEEDHHVSILQWKLESKPS